MLMTMPMSVFRLSVSLPDKVRLWSQNTQAVTEEDDEPITPEGLETTPNQESGDEDEAESYRPSATEGTVISDNDDDSDLCPPEWEIGIRRSSRAQGSAIEDLTLSDIILDPDGNLSYYWLGIVCTSVIYNIAVIILRLSFREMRDEVIQDSVFYILDSISDLIYILDILVHLRMSFYEEGCLVLDPNRIVEHYIKQRRFIFDLLAVVPLGTVSCLLVGNLHILPARIPRLLKYSSMVKFFDLTDSRTRNPNWIRAFKLSLNLWIVIHWIGCVYYMLSEYEGLGTNDWVYPNGTEFNTFSRKYIRVMYWSLMTLTTIGERPAPETDLEFVFTGLTFLIGVFVFAAVVGNVGDVISNMNAARQEFQGRMDQIKFYLQHRRVPEKLQNRVKRWADYTWARTQAIDEPTLLQMLPDRLRTEIAINVHLETLKKVKIFEECEEGLLRELVLKLRPQIYSPGDYICRIGEVGREMFIVNHGKVEILIPNGQSSRRTVIATLNPGNYFGEISLLKLDDGQNRRTADVRAVGYSELLRLSRKDLLSALVEYPNAKKILESQAKERMKKTKEVTQNATGDSSPQEMPTENRNRKKDMLLEVIRSPNFKKLLSSGKSEATEIKNVLQELKSFDSQATKQELESLRREKDELKRKLQKTTKELEKSRRTVRAILARDSSQSSDIHMSRRMKPVVSNGIRDKKDKNQFVPDNSHSDLSDKCDDDVISQKVKSRVVPHSLPLCQVESSKSASGKVKTSFNGHDTSVTNSSPQEENKCTKCSSQEQSPSDEGTKLPKDFNCNNCVGNIEDKSYCQTKLSTVVVPDINIFDESGTSLVADNACDGVDNPTTEVINNLIAMDLDCGGLYLSDRSSNSDTSDHSDFEFDDIDGTGL